MCSSWSPMMMTTVWLRHSVQVKLSKQTLPHLTKNSCLKTTVPRLSFSGRLTRRILKVFNLTTSRALSQEPETKYHKLLQKHFFFLPINIKYCCSNWRNAITGGGFQSGGTMWIRIKFISVDGLAWFIRSGFSDGCPPPHVKRTRSSLFRSIFVLFTQVAWRWHFNTFGSDSLNVKHVWPGSAVQVTMATNPSQKETETLKIGVLARKFRWLITF